MWHACVVVGVKRAKVKARLLATLENAEISFNIPFSIGLLLI